MITEWQNKWENGKHGRWTYKLIPNIEKWITRGYGEVDYYITQALSGHGCFGKYLFVRKKKTTPQCIYCHAEDDAEHTLFECLRWDQIRGQYLQDTKKVFNIGNVANSLVDGENAWDKVTMIIRHIMENKEKESQMMQSLIEED